MIVTLSGKFSEEDLKKIARLLRSFERLNTKELYLMTIEGWPEVVSADEAVARIQKIFPKLEVAG